MKSLFIKDIALSARQTGWLRTIKLMPKYIGLKVWMIGFERNQRKELAKEGFDKRHGTDTAEMMYGSELGFFFNSRKGEVHAYQAVKTEFVTRPLDLLSFDLSQYTFIDIGCGKAKPLLVASDYPFKKLVGIEISPPCVSIARQNIEIYKSPNLDKSRFIIIENDIEDYVFPNEPSVIFMFNPFGREVLQRVLKNLEGSLREYPRNVLIIYINPSYNDVIDSSDLFSRVPTIGEFTSVWATKPVDWAWPRSPRDTIHASGDHQSAG